MWPGKKQTRFHVVRFNRFNQFLACQLSVYKEQKNGLAKYVFMFIVPRGKRMLLERETTRRRPWCGLKRHACCCFSLHAGRSMYPYVPTQQQAQLRR